jgi:SAM-dependent methyltransferase
MLAYYSTAAREEFWTEHWGRHSVAGLLAIARTSPLTTLVADALPPEGRVLEAGCGLGQYVLLLRERGWRVAGVDWSVDALAACRRAAAAPLAAMDLSELAFRDGAFNAYVSLGVVEHDRTGPDAILAEARRVLGKGGVAIVSVPYLNGLRRLGEPLIRRRNRRLARRGGDFYQYAFSRRELAAALARHGFAPIRFAPYDPARILRGLARRRAAVAPPPARPGESAPRPPALAADGTSRPPASAGRAALRRLLYSPPALRLLGHMLLAVAVKR